MHTIRRLLETRVRSGWKATGETALLPTSCSRSHDLHVLTSTTNSFLLSLRLYGERRTCTCTPFSLCRYSSSSSSSRMSNGLEVLYPDLPNMLGAGSDICNLTAYVVDPLHPFENEDIFKETTVELGNFSTWWHTSTLGQERETSATSTSASGSALVLLGDPGIYFACLVPGDEECVAADCVEFVVYQPNNDFFQVSALKSTARVLSTALIRAVVLSELKTKCYEISRPAIQTTINACIHGIHLVWGAHIACRRS